MRDYRRLTTSPWRQKPTHATVPRVEQSYQAVYPKLDVNDMLEVDYARPAGASASAASSDPLAPQQKTGLATSETKDETTSKGSSVHLFKPTQALQTAGYALPFTRPNTYLRNDPIATTVHPEELVGQTERAEPGKYDDLAYVDYDMDEQDAAVMGHLIAKYQAPLTAEVFETVMSMLEVEAFKLQLKIGTSGNAPRHQTDETSQCVVCCATECENGNEIVFCDGCNIAVHQDCYGVPFIPEGGWFCRKCQLAREHSVTCLFCPHTDGAFKLTEAGHWAHTVCALWIPELHFLNAAYMEPIAGVASIPRSRWRLTCSICQQRGGACIQCSYKSCCQAFHVTCAQAAGQYMAMTDGVSAAVNNPSTMVVYCDKHTPKDANLMVGVKTARHVLKLQALKAATKGGKRIHPFWRTSSGVFVMPKLIADAVCRNINNRFAVDISGVMPQLCRYWTIKQDRQGMLLSKRLKRILDTAQYNFSSAEERSGDLTKRVKSLSSLIDVVNKIRDQLAEPAQRGSDKLTLESSPQGSLPSVPATPVSATPGEDSDASVDEPVTDSEAAAYDVAKPVKKTEKRAVKEIEIPRRRLRDLRTEPKSETEPEPKPEPKSEPKQEVEQEVKPEAETKVEPAGPPTPRRLRSTIAVATQAPAPTPAPAATPVSPRRTRSSATNMPVSKRQLRSQTVVPQPAQPAQPAQPVQPAQLERLKAEAKPTNSQRKTPMSKAERARKEKARQEQRNIDRRIQRAKEREQREKLAAAAAAEAARAEKAQKSGNSKRAVDASASSARPKKSRRLDPPRSRLRWTPTRSYVI